MSHLWFRTNTDFRPPYTILNSLELVEKIEKREIPPNSILVSFAIVNMYSNVPINPAIEQTKALLQDHNIPPLVIDEFVVLLETCLETSICQFLNRVYKFPDGLPMGSPLASLMADIFLNSIENDIFNSNRRHSLLVERH